MPMIRTHLTRSALCTAAALLVSQTAAHALSPKAPDTASITAQTQAAHKLSAWNQKEIVQADAQMVFGGNKIVDGRFTFEAHGPRARYDRKDGVSILFDGKTAWVSPADAEAPMGRFHVLTWPWFIMAPFKMQGDGITLSELSVRKIGAEPYLTLKQTFASDMGDAPDDWYRFFIDQKTMQIEAMSYIVTYGKDAEEANKQPSIIRYLDYVDTEGPVISTRYEFWYWNPESRSYVGDQPKGVGKISNISYLNAAQADFSVPADARELKLPGQAIDYSDYARLLDRYVTASGVRYDAWFKNKADLKALDDFLAELAQVDLTEYSEDETVAFYINLYNAAMLQAVFKNYPIKSVKDIGDAPFSIFKKPFIKQNGRTLSLDGIEKGILLKDYFDPRIHFAVNCASESCPPLLAEPFTADKLEAQMEKQIRAFAHSTRAAQVNKRKKSIQFSELFNWYAKDFAVTNPAEYLNRYRSKALPLDYKTDWIKYDWSLNAAK